MDLDSYLNEAGIALGTGDETVSRQFIETWTPLVINEITKLRATITKLRHEVMLLEIVTEE